MAEIRVLAVFTLVFYSLLVSACVFEVQRKNNIPVVGVWRNTEASFFGSGWDQCVFKADLTFSCMNYPKDGDLVLPYDGNWSLVGNEFQLYFDVEPILTFVVSSINNDVFVLQNKVGETLFYEKVK